jgi:glycosyltransferase involved in cell wall biosynthesis
LDVNALPAALLGGRRRTASEGYFSDRAAISALGALYRTLVNFPDGAVGWIGSAVRAGNRLIAGWRPDVIYASALPFSALVVARRLARKHGLPWLAELRDLWTEHPYTPAPRGRAWLDRRLEAAVLRDASGLVTVSEPLAERLSRFGPPVEVIMNGYDPRDFPDATASSDGPLRIVYTGMIYPGFRNPLPLLAAMAKVRHKADLRLEFYGRSLRAPLVASAREQGVEDLVTVHGTVSYAESLALQRKADVLLMLLWNDRMEKGMYSAKLFEYFGSRRPILAVGPGDDVAGVLVRGRSAGFVSDDPEAIASWLLERCIEKSRGGIPDLPETARRGLSRDEQFQRLDAFIARVSQG